jgi:hypothetical protein
VSGSRKYHLALWGLAALCAGFVLAALRSLPASLYSEFSWGVVGLLLAFGVPNVGEHVAKALAVRKGAQP